MAPLRPGRLLLAVMVCVVLCTGASGRAAPYDPRPLMQQLDPEGSGPYTFAVFGDSYASRPLQDLLDFVTAKSPTFVITAGDMVALGSEPITWHTLGHRAGGFMRTIPSWPVVGNHELFGEGRAGAMNLAAFYGLPADSYVFRSRNSKFIFLDERGVAPDDQIAFLREELVHRDRYDHVFVFRHRPFYTAGAKSRGEVPNKPTELTRLFSRGQVTAVFSGHDHSYYHTRRDGVDYLISANAGSGMYPLRRLREQIAGDAHVGRTPDRKSYLLHLPTGPERQVGCRASSPRRWLFAIFVHVDGDLASAETIAVTGEVWEQFSLGSPPPRAAD